MDRDDELERSILSLLDSRALSSTICPSDAARGPIRIRRRATAIPAAAPATPEE